MSVSRFIWGLLLSVFFVSTFTLSLPLSEQLFVSPDENAAFVFARQIADTGSPALPEPLNDDLRGLLHPRSALGFGEAVVPASFVGFLFVLAVVGKIFGWMAMYAVTPLLAVLSILLWKDIVRRLFHDDRLAHTAAFLLMIHPAFWYYSGRVMMHNIAFLACLIAGVWLVLALPLSARVKKHVRSSARLVDFFLGGLLVGLALFIRTYEVIWIAPATAIIFVMYRNALGWRAMASFAAGVGVLMLGLAGVHTLVYGDPFMNGYNVRNIYETEEAILEAAPTNAQGTAPAQSSLLLPFGFHERVILGNVVNYGFKLYPWMSILAIIGMVLVLADKTEKARTWKHLAIFTLILATWMGVVYGSWKIVDNPDPKIISLGNSHVRYWLPLFALASIFAARALRYIFGDRPFTLPTHDPEVWLRTALGCTIIALTTLLSLQLVFFGEDGFIPSRAALATFADKRERLLEVTEPEAIVIVDRADKYLFPARRVVVPLRSEVTYAALPKMLELAPVYYFGITLPQADLDYLNEQKLPPLGVKVEYVETLQEESLYRFVVVD